ncbi:MAG: hypothetical protein DHS20C18_38590 [Saprospiraceae bacterium]|nr:MAG: hypothetical protein DHS20C18_38590 [Saprospiraceae bacterium]
MENLSFQYPAWYLLFCIVLGLGYALVLYFRDTTFQEQGSRVNWPLGILRFLAVTILSALLLSPLLKSVQNQKKKPVIVFAQDESESVAAAMNEEERAAYQQKMEQLKASFDDKYEIKAYDFGSEVREGIGYTYQDKVSNISKFLNNVYDLYSNQNLGAVILATDGIYNEGSNPLYSGSKITVPVYTIALGDTTPKRDLILKRVFNNRIAYLGDKFTIQIDIAAQNCPASATTLSVYKVEDGQTTRLTSENITIDRNDFFTTKEIILDADKSGVQRYRLSLSPIANEQSTINNTKDIFVDVLDARQKILILANAPHPDLTALRQSLSTNKNYQVEVANINGFQKTVRDYDLVILHQLPSLTNDANSIISTINDQKIPAFFIVGGQSNIQRLNQVQALVNIRPGTSGTNEVQARLAPDFNLFTIGETISNDISTFPPLIAPFGEFDLVGDGQVLLYQRIGKIDTRYPLLLLGDSNGAKRGVLCAEGLWKWRLFDYLQHENHFIFDELLGKALQYVGVKEDKRRFRVNVSKNIFDENEAIYFDAELYNNSYELINVPDVNLTIADNTGKEFNFVFTKTENAYVLNAGLLPVGNYTFRSTTSYNGEQFNYTGQFSVQPIQLEVYETTADHSMLRLLSDKFGGKLVYPNQMEQITSLIEEKGTVKPINYTTTKTKSVINLKWIFFLLLGLISVEWFFRRYWGGY